MRFKTKEILVELYSIDFVNDNGENQTDYLVEVVEPYWAPGKPWDGDWLHTDSAGFSSLEQAVSWAAEKVVKHYKHYNF